MSDQPSIKPNSAKHSISFGSVFLWLAIVFGIYVLSSGPVLMMAKTRSAKAHVIKHYYFPLLWFYQSSPLKKVFGLYFHLWIPEDFDSSGQQISDPPPSKP